MSYFVGAAVRLSITIDTGDPDRLVVRLKVPRAVNPETFTFQTLTSGVDAALVHDGAGAYHLDVATAAAGVFYWRAEAYDENPPGTFTLTGADEGSFSVSPSGF